MKILAVVGDYYHSEASMKRALEGVADELNGVELVFTNRKKLIQDLNREPDLVILGSENRMNPNKEVSEIWLTEDTATEIAKYVESGGSWLAWHSGMASYEKIRSYTDMLGGFFKYHPEKHQPVTYLYQSHSLFEDKSTSFQIIDEHYFVKYDEDVDVFLKSESVDGVSVGGWTKGYGEGRVACYTPAHLENGMQRREVKDDLKRLIEWCLNR